MHAHTHTLTERERETQTTEQCVEKNVRGQWKLCGSFIWSPIIRRWQDKIWKLKQTTLTF